MEGRRCRGYLEGAHGCTHPSQDIIGHSPRGWGCCFCPNVATCLPAPSLSLIQSLTLALLFYHYMCAFYQRDQQGATTVWPIGMNSRHENTASNYPARRHFLKNRAGGWGMVRGQD